MAKIKISKPKFNFNFKICGSLIHKELKNYFDGATAYVIFSVFIFFHLLLFFFIFQFFSIQKSDLSPLFRSMPLVFLFIIPALTMASISEEKREGTIEYLLTKPISIAELVVSKVASVVLFTVLMLAVEFLLIIFILSFGSFDYKQIFAQYIAALFLIIAMSSFGVFVSTIVKNQLSGYLLTFIALLVIFLVGWQPIALLFPVKLTALIERGSLLTQFQSMLNGAIDLRTVLYFAGFSTIFTLGSYYKLVSLKLPTGNQYLKNVRIASVIALVLISVITVFGQKIPGRLDLTRNRINSLSQVSKDLIGNLSKEVTVTLYYSNNLPIQFQDAKLTAFNLLRDYAYSTSNSNFRIIYKPVVTQEDMNNAESEGILGMTFQENNLSNVNFSKVYLGMTIVSGDKKEPVSQIVQIPNLEYEITSIVKKITSDQQSKIGIISSNVKLSPYGDNNFNSYSNLDKYLRSEYEVEEIDPTAETFAIDNATIKVLIIPGPNMPMDEKVKAEIQRYFNDGGKVFLMLDPINVDIQQAGVSGSINPDSMGDIFDYLGVKVGNRMLYEMKNYGAVFLQGFSQPIPYAPFIITEPVDSQSPITIGLSGINLYWSSYLDTDTSKNPNVTINKLLQTTQNAGLQGPDSFDIDLQTNQILQQTNPQLSRYTTAVTIEEKDDKPGRAVVVADADFISDFATQDGQNGIFVANSIEWLTQETSLSKIQLKSLSAPPIILGSGILATIIQFLGPVALIIIILSVGGVKYYLRKVEMERKYVMGN